MKSKNTIFPLLLLPLLLASCAHKDLYYPVSHNGHLNVIFDWRNAPDAAPASMALYLYNADGTKPLRYIFPNKDGGPLHVSTGLYHGICLNADINDWAVISHEEGIDDYTVSTSDASVLSVSGIPTAALPATTRATERIAATPAMLWADRLNNIQTPKDKDDKTIILYPEEKVCHYTIDIYDCGDVTQYPATGVDATLSGMAEGYRIGRDCPHENQVSHPIILTPDLKEESLHSEFLTFGVYDKKERHILSLYMVREDGVKWNCNVDVSDRVNNAPDPHHVHIIVRGIKVPIPKTGTGSYVDADVESWETVDILLPM